MHNNAKHQPQRGSGISASQPRCCSSTTPCGSNNALCKSNAFALRRSSAAVATAVVVLLLAHTPLAHADEEYPYYVWGMIDKVYPGDYVQETMYGEGEGLVIIGGPPEDIYIPCYFEPVIVESVIVVPSCTGVVHRVTMAGSISGDLPSGFAGYYDNYDSHNCWLGEMFAHFYIITGTIPEQAAVEHSDTVLVVQGSATHNDIEYDKVWYCMQESGDEYTKIDGGFTNTYYAGNKVYGRHYDAYYWEESETFYYRLIVDDWLDQTPLSNPRYNYWPLSTERGSYMPVATSTTASYTNGYLYKAETWYDDDIDADIDIVHVQSPTEGLLCVQTLVPTGSAPIEIFVFQGADYWSGTPVGLIAHNASFNFRHNGSSDNQTQFAVFNAVSGTSYYVQFNTLDSANSAEYNFRFLDVQAAMTNMVILTNGLDCIVLDPVAPADGRVTSFPQHDLVVKDAAAPLDLFRVYDSTRSTDGPFGVGWNHSYNVTLEASDYLVTITGASALPSAFKRFLDSDLFISDDERALRLDKTVTV